MHDEHDRDPISERLAALADQINAEHEACDAAMRDGLRHALKAGELLTEAKGRVGHGLWGDWLGLNFKGSERTARAYMQAAREFAALPDAKRQRVAEMPYRDVLKVLAEGAAEGERQGERVPVADQNADRRTATEAVAGANDVTPESARRDLVAEVDAVRNATEREGERREEKGEPFPVEEREEYARKLAEMRKHRREADERHREQESKNGYLMLLEMNGNLDGARKLLRKALDIAIRAEFAGEDLEIMEQRYDELRAVFNLVGAALAGDSGTDWDAELAKLGE
jgi:hypothetical protein